MILIYVLDIGLLAKYHIPCSVVDLHLMEPYKTCSQ